MLTQVAHALPLPRKPDIALPLRGKRADEFSGLGALGIAMSFARNMEIYAEGEPAGNVYKVVSGVVRISKLLPDGRRQISAFHTAGDMFGFEADDLHNASAEAVTPVKVIAYKWQSLLRQHPLGERRSRSAQSHHDRAPPHPGASPPARAQERA